MFQDTQYLVRVVKLDKHKAPQGKRESAQECLAKVVDTINSNLETAIAKERSRTLQKTPPKTGKPFVLKTASSVFEAKSRLVSAVVPIA